MQDNRPTIYFTWTKREHEEAVEAGGEALLGDDRRGAQLDRFNDGEIPVLVVQGKDVSDWRPTCRVVHKFSPDFPEGTYKEQARARKCFSQDLEDAGQWPG